MSIIFNLCPFKGMNVWVDLINSLSFLPDFVSDPASYYLTTNLYSVYEATTVSVQNASRSDTIQLSIISTIPNLSGSNLLEY
jgi:hypothetical protein